MKKLITTIVLSVSLLNLAGKAKAETFEHWERWDKQDKALFVASQALLVADWSQTRKIAKNPSEYREYNIILGKHPSVDKVDAYFLSTMTLNYVLAAAFPEYRKDQFKVLIGVETLVVHRNTTIGLSVGF